MIPDNRLEDLTVESVIKLFREFPRREAWAALADLADESAGSSSHAYWVGTLHLQDGHTLILTEDSQGFKDWFFASDVEAEAALAEAASLDPSNDDEDASDYNEDDSDYESP